MVSQNVVLFDDTLAANIAYGAEHIDHERLAGAIRAAHLTDVVARLPEGIDTRIGENGSRLSGGQRQRVAIARAIYKDAPLLILDEATSALDNESERAVQSALDTLMAGRTTIVIAHRLSTIERADRIVVMEAGPHRGAGHARRTAGHEGHVRESVLSAVHGREETASLACYAVTSFPRRREPEALSLPRPFWCNGSA